MPVGELADAVLLLGTRALEFARVERTASLRPDGRPETDSDHTVMLAWLAPCLADLLYPDLDANLVGVFASVHDAVEVFAGDTPTLRITAQERLMKHERERAAARRWEAEFGSRLPWITVMIGRYEAQTEPEARFVRAVDKLCPPVVHLGNGVRDLMEYGITADEIARDRPARRAETAVYAADFPEVLDLRDELSVRQERMLRLREKTARQYPHPQYMAVTGLTAEQ